jgi:hypothetical protein
MSKFTREDIQEIARGLADLIQESVPDRDESDNKLRNTVREVLISKYGLPLEMADAFASSAAPEALRFILAAYSFKVDSV